MKLELNNTTKIISGIIIGGILGYTYYYFIGCNSGGCAITGNPINSTLYGAALGLIWGLPTGKKKLGDKNEQNNN